MQNQTVFGDRNPTRRTDLSRHNCNDGRSTAKAGLLLRGDGELCVDWQIKENYA
jgi:hypothetical protein